jgi:hypothetical protein
MSAVILVPSQGQHAGLFLASARSVLAKVYGGSGKIFKTLIADSLLNNTILGGGLPPVLQFIPDKGDGPVKFFDAVKTAKAFIWIGHHGIIDGPILAHGDEHFGGNSQIWDVDPDTNQLKIRGKTFWTQIGKGRPAGAKNMLMGCNSGLEYALKVAKASNLPTFGWVTTCPAADSKTQITSTSNIERFGKSPGMNVSKPK